jgi:hypothetical protein
LWRDILPGKGAGIHARVPPAVPKDSDQGEESMSKKREIHQVVHCGLILTLKNGSATCPKCHKTVTGHISEKAVRRDYKKHSPSFGKPKDLWPKLGVVLLFLASVMAWNEIHSLFEQGFSAFRMDLFTFTLMTGIIGWLLAFGAGKGRRA